MYRMTFGVPIRWTIRHDPLDLAGDQATHYHHPEIKNVQIHRRYGFADQVPRKRALPHKWLQNFWLSREGELKYFTFLVI